jgi:hypothetical protein
MGIAPVKALPNPLISTKQSSDFGRSHNNRHGAKVFTYAQNAKSMSFDLLAVGCSLTKEASNGEVLQANNRYVRR